MKQFPTVWMVCFFEKELVALLSNRVEVSILEGKGGEIGCCVCARKMETLNQDVNLNLFSFEKWLQAF